MLYKYIQHDDFVIIPASISCRPRAGDMGLTRDRFLAAAPLPRFSFRFYRRRETPPSATMLAYAESLRNRFLEQVR